VGGGGFFLGGGGGGGFFFFSFLLPSCPLRANEREEASPSVSRKQAEVFPFFLLILGGVDQRK